MIRRIHSGGRRPRRGEVGITLIEVTIVLMIIGIIVPVIFTLLYTVQKDEVSASSRTAAAGVAQVMDEALSRQIHAAAIPVGQTNAIVQAMPNSLQFYSSLSSASNSNGPSEVNISTALTCTTCTTYKLVEQITTPGTGTNPYTTAGGATTVTRTLGTGIVPPSATAVGNDCSTTPGIFQYYTANNGTPSCVVIPSGGLTGTATGAIDYIYVTLTTIDVTRPTTSPQTTYTLHVTLPNVDFYDQTTTTT
jgi:type II secretory pathway pseudopilin PulG